MEFIGYAYDTKEFIEILKTLPEYSTVVISVGQSESSTPEVWYDEYRQEVILK